LWGGSTVFGRMLLNKLSFQATTAARFLTALVFLLLMQIYSGQLADISQASQKDWMFVLIIAVLAGLLSLFIYYKGLKNTPASIATLCELGFPLSAVVVNWIFIPNSQLTFAQIGGGVLLLGAITALSWENTASKPTLSES
jgi:uncharacterized membrane protein